MSRSEKATFTTMCMIYDHEGHILVQNRVSQDWPGITFPGGHVEKGESFTKGVIREVWEETGLTIESPILCGIKQFQTDGNERYVVLLYKTDKVKGTLHSSKEGPVFWIRRDEIENYPLAKDFLEMLEIFEDDSLSEFFYYMENEEWQHCLL